jgi:broad specificity phosphatase PhoE
MRVILVRHGETPSNRDHLALGRADPPLSDLGIRQARAVAETIARWSQVTPIDGLYTSPQLRAHQTASIIAGALNRPYPTVLEGLMEMDVGETDGLTSAELRERYPEFLRGWFSDAAGEVPMPGGESLAQVQERAWRAIETLREQHPLDASVVAVSHNFVIRTLVCKALGMALADFRRFQQDLAAITVIEFRGQRTLITKLNETCHLGGLIPSQPALWR